MTPDEKPVNAAAAEEKTEAKSPAEIRAEIDATRDELGDTVEALAEKTDVKAQAKAKVDENPKPLAIAGGVVVLFLLWRWLRS
jgi:hypothetical protein